VINKNKRRDKNDDEWMTVQFIYQKAVSVQIVPKPLYQRITLDIGGASIIREYNLHVKAIPNKPIFQQKIKQQLKSQL
jgi:hypothetical protein